VVRVAGREHLKSPAEIVAGLVYVEVGSAIPSQDKESCGRLDQLVGFGVTNSPSQVQSLRIVVNKDLGVVTDSISRYLLDPFGGAKVLGTLH